MATGHRQHPAGRLCDAPGPAGDVVAMPLDGELFLEKGAFLASSEGVKCDAKFSGLRGFFNEGLFILRCTGRGTLFFNAYGEIQEIEVQAIELARGAGRILMDRFHKPMAVEFKDKEGWKDPVTEADKAAEAYLSEETSRRFPDHGFVGEEGGG